MKPSSFFALILPLLLSLLHDEFLLRDFLSIQENAISTICKNIEEERRYTDSLIPSLTLISYQSYEAIFDSEVLEFSFLLKTKEPYVLSSSFPSCSFTYNREEDFVYRK